MSVCCPPGGIGPAPLSTITPKGEVVSLEGSGDRPEIPCYQVGSKTPKLVIVVFSDVFGVDVGNHKAFCDVLQEKLGSNTAVWMPDLFRGSPVFSNYGPLTLPLSLPYFFYSIYTRLTAPKIEYDLTEIIQRDLNQTGCEVVGCAGFCFGGWVIARCLALEGGIYSAGVGIHPSWKPETLIPGGSTEASLGESTKDKPIFLLPAKQDVELKPDTDLVKALAERRGTTADKISVEFPDMAHGWVSRGDSSKPEIKENQDKATQLIAEFFEEKLKV